MLGPKLFLGEGNVGNVVTEVGREASHSGVELLWFFVVIWLKRFAG
jgi:hypothetical protein